MHLISLEGISKSFPENPVLDNVSLGISYGDRIGVIGRNGSGKSTLLAVISGEIEPDEGSNIRASGLTIARLAQDPTFASDATVASVVGNDRSAIALADKLGLTEPHKLCSALSGGQRKRLALAVALGTECDLLILDEPTNHLDVDTIDWLEDHLHDRKEALLLVTHDRYLLDRVANRIFEVHDRTLYSHRGTYEQYLEEVARRETHANVVEHRLQRRIKTELEWLRRSPKARTSKSKARIDQAHDLMSRQRRQTSQGLSIDLPSRRLGSKVVNLHNVGKRYDDDWVLRHVDWNLHSDARIGVVGPNGAGKTTLLSLIGGRLSPDEGKVVTGDTVHPGWYGQDPRAIPATTRLRDAVREHAEEIMLASGMRVSGSQLLERFLFSRDQQQSEVGDLSGGERRRLELLLSLMEAPNLLLLDEPTNDLDIETLTVLEEYLDVWPGAVVVSSHDRYFLERTCSDIFSIRDDGAVAHHPGGWVAYRKATRRSSSSSRVATTRPGRPKQQLKRLTYNDKRELERLAKSIPRLESQRDGLAEQLDSAEGDLEVIVRKSEELASVIVDLDTAETRWLELTEKAEALKRG